MRARRRPSRAGPALSLVGAGAMVGGTLLPFLPGWVGYRTPDGKLSIGAGIVIGVLALISSRATSRLPAALTAAVALLMLAASIVDIAGAARPGPGLVVVGAGALVAAIGASVAMPRAVRRHAGRPR